MFVLLFAFVFGGAILLPGYTDSNAYREYLLPGVFCQTISFAAATTAVGMCDDINKGIIDRFRSLPMARSAVIAGRTASDIVMNMIALTTMVVFGVIVGFSFHAPGYEIVAGFGLVLLFGYAMSWVYCYIGLIASSPESASALITVVIFPLTFVSSAYVPTASMPAVMQAIANANPITSIVDALRSLWIDAPAGNDVWVAVLWCVGIIAVFSLLATSRYRRAVMR
jgi:ABC-2 type transport system permease protein/oleandomycin transport system permease protein